MTNCQAFPAEKLDQVDLNNGIIVDVRTDMEHAEKRLSCPHAHVPLDELNPAEFMTQHGLDKDAGVYILCRSGGRAAKAAEKFMMDGYRNVHVIEGGILACETCGARLSGYGEKEGNNGPATTPVSLERQVRITAGCLVAVGAVLGLTVNTLFTVIPLAVGCGLVFAGVTDRCGMALILAKAPWNKTNGSCCATRKPHIEGTNE